MIQHHHFWFNNFWLQQIGKKNLRQDSRQPITYIILQRLMEALDHTSSSVYNNMLFRAMYVIAFFSHFASLGMSDSQICTIGIYNAFICYIICQKILNDVTIV